VLINLLENAIKHTPVTAAVEVSVIMSGGKAVFEVADNGPGIPADEFPYLFESFVPNGKRSSDSSRGMGIGLSICMTIIKAHQGKMEARNKKKGGAVFRFLLPLEESESSES
jgi:two-component system sensor histidine kinase KdpD